MNSKSTLKPPSEIPVPLSYAVKSLLHADEKPVTAAVGWKLLYVSAIKKLRRRRMLRSGSNRRQSGRAYSRARDSEVGS